MASRELEETDSEGKKHVARSDKGTPQGGVVSALLSNVYLHWFEIAFHKESGPAHFAKAKIVRYADDFVVLARYQGRELRAWLQRTLEERFELTINRDKTRVVNLNVPVSSLDFVGYTFRYDRDLKGRAHRYLNIFPSRKALAKGREAIRNLTSTSRSYVPVVTMIAEINHGNGMDYLLWLRLSAHGVSRQPFLHSGEAHETSQAAKSAALPSTGREVFLCSRARPRSASSEKDLATSL